MIETKTIHAVLTEANEKDSVEERIQVLQENDSKVLRFVLQMAFDDNVQTLLPDGEPPFNPVPKQDQVTLHAMESKLPSLFKYGPMSKAPATKVEMFFIDMLSKLKKEEANLLVYAKDKRLNVLFKKLTKNVVKKFFGDSVNIK